MRIVRAILAASFSGLVAAGAAGQGSLTAPQRALSSDAGEAAPDQGADSREARLDELFETLAAAPSAEAAKATERMIVEMWMESGSDTIDLLMRWTLRAMDDKDYPLALDFLDRITTLNPDYAEGWNKRATVYFLTDDYAKSLADLERVLALEPRHFAALSGLGTILSEIGDDRQAAVAYRRALELDPHLENVQDALDEIDGAGEGI